MIRPLALPETVGVSSLAAMRFTNLFAPTLRQDPADADVVSHRLLLRAGYIRRVTSGVYDLLPLGLRVLRHIETIIRQELDAAGAQELLLPMVQPAELWQQSGRWDKYGRELLRLVDRHDHASCLGPTHEEVICHLVAGDLRSWRQLPMNLYQIQAKFRDEVRPRFGLMRGREFTMKDGYSFHADDEDLAREYDHMFATYQRIFRRLGLNFRAVEADTGSIGGNRSHEFHVLADSGEDLIAYCTECDYAANVEKAISGRAKPLATGNEQPLAQVATLGVTEVDAVAKLLDIAPSQLVKTLIYRVTGGELDGKTIAICIAGDDQLQEIKLQRAIHAEALEMASDAEITEAGGVIGYIGPQGLTCPLFADTALQAACDLIAGANQNNTHLRHLSMPRDAANAHYFELRQSCADDQCPHCGGTIALARGIEVGQVFALGRQYTEPMEVGFQDRDGKRATATMGCYGIGVSRLVAAIVEQCHDEAGICWPMAVAPFQVALITLGNGEMVTEASAELYQQLTEANIDTLWDDRKERPGVKFKDAELMGLPLQLVVGERGLKDGMVELKPRQGEKQLILLADALSHCLQSVANPQ
ncbi:MAG: proline--tRNA ligase [Mariprofundales bacterium]|nr:proline--tRNA ligase [Mariprofundales bacterium]